MLRPLRTCHPPKPDPRDWPLAVTGRAKHSQTGLRALILVDSANAWPLRTRTGRSLRERHYVSPVIDSLSEGVSQSFVSVSEDLVAGAAALGPFGVSWDIAATAFTALQVSAGFVSYATNQLDGVTWG